MLSSTITGFPFLEYHTDLDTPDKLDHEAMNETYDVIVKIVEIQENDGTARKVGNGLYFLSNPRYDLYRSAPEPGISKVGQTANEKKLEPDDELFAKRSPEWSINTRHQYQI